MLLSPAFLSMLMRAMLLVVVALLPATSRESETESIQDQQPPEETEITAMGTDSRKNFTLHDMNYAAVGRHDAKMQFSFKYRVSDEMDLYLAYTNLVVWDIYEESYPYRDVNFIPEAFWRFEPCPDWWHHADLGYIHNSNGAADENARSWDRVFARFRFDQRLFDRDLIVMPMVWATVAKGDSTRNIENYLGYWNLRFIYRRLLDPETENLDASLFIHSGNDGRPFDRGAISASLKYTLTGYDLNPSLFLEYYKGYGNSLVEYDRRIQEVRLGLAFHY